MLRINLLPSYVPQRRLTRKLIFGFSALLALCVLVPLFLYLQASQQKASWLSQATAAEAGKAKTDALRQQTQATTAQIAPIQAKVDFVKAVHQHNTDIGNFWATVAAYSDPKVIYSDAVVSGNALTIKAYSPSLAEIGRYLQAMYQEPDFQSVAIDKLPGYPEAVVAKVYLGNQLIAYETYGSQSTPGGQGGFGGGQGGFGGQQGPGGFGRGGSGQGRTGGGAGDAQTPAYGSAVELGPTANGNQIPTISGGTGTGKTQFDPQQISQVILGDRAVRNVVLNPFARPQTQAQAVANIGASLRNKIKVRLEPQGFPVTVTATLKQPLTVPPLPGSAPAAGAGGFPGSFAGPGRGPGG